MQHNATCPPRLEDRAYLAPYERVAMDLRAAIVAGAYGVGTRVPGITQLGKRYGVSEMTAHRALKLLTEEGLIEPRRGVGLFVLERDGWDAIVIPVGRPENVARKLIQCLSREDLLAVKNALDAELMRTN